MNESQIEKVEDGTHGSIPDTAPCTRRSVLPVELTTITPLSKYLALALFVVLPFVGFWLGMNSGIGTEPQLPAPILPTVPTVPIDDGMEESDTPPDATNPGDAASTTPAEPEPAEPIVSDEPPAVSASCEITNCHGLDIACGPATEPLACTMMYMVGDGCRQFASCEIVAGACAPVLSQQFTECATCVEQCEVAHKGEPDDVLACEQVCMEQ